MLLVHKYGGTSLADIKRLYKSAEHIKESVETGNSVVAVVSAMGHQTDDLISTVCEISESVATSPSRNLDMLLSCGEQKSAALLSMVLQEMGIDARPYGGWQLPIITDGLYGSARIVSVNVRKLRRDIRNKCVPIITGFQGVSTDGDITTLGRGGSDTTAVALAAALKADECRIYTDVDGVYTADPRVVPQARLLEKITLEEMLELSALGSKVLEPRSVTLAVGNRIHLRVLSAFKQPKESQGTLILKKGDKEMEETIVAGIAHNKGEAKITISEVSDTPGVASVILNRISEEKIEVDMIVQNVSTYGKTDFTFTLRQENYTRAMKALETLKKDLSFKSISGNKKIGKVSLVGWGMRSHSGVASRMFSALAEENINIQIISTSEIRTSVVIDEQDVENAVRCLHKEFDMDTKGP